LTFKTEYFSGSKTGEGKGWKTGEKSDGRGGEVASGGYRMKASQTFSGPGRKGDKKRLVKKKVGEGKRWLLIGGINYNEVTELA